MITKLLLTTLALLGLASSEDVRPGFTASASIDGINEITHVVAPVAFKYF